jgi:hypothetical protein
MDAPTKILVTGATGAGKTTLVQSLSDIPVVATDERTSDLSDKPSTTVALDYGQLTVDGRDIHLFGTPGQERFAYMWETLSTGADGMILLVNALQEENAAKTTVLLDRIHEAVPDLPFVVGLTHMDRHEGPDAAAAPPGIRDAACDVVPTDPRDVDSSRHLLSSLVADIDGSTP